MHRSIANDVTWRRCPVGAGRSRPASKKRKVKSEWTITKHAAGWAGIIRWCNRSWHISFSRACASGLKKVPALTTAQAHQLVICALQDDDQLTIDTIAIIEYRQRRNHAAYCSHRKQTLKRLR